MSAIILPKDLEAWAEAEVKAGRAKSVEQLVAKAVVTYRQLWEDFRKSLDDAEAEADEKGWLELDEVFDHIDERIDAREAFEQEWSKRSKRA